MKPPLRLGPIAQHPAGPALIHRPIPEHVQHLAGQKHSTTISGLARGHNPPPSHRGHFPGR